MQDFWNMGGYAFYVWMSYGLTALVLLANWVMPVMKETMTKRSLARKHATGGQHASRS